MKSRTIAALLFVGLCVPVSGQIERAEALFADNQFSEALTEYVRAIETDPSQGLAYVRLAMILLMANELDKAESYLDAALRAEPASEPVVNVLRGEMHRRANEFDLAAAVYARSGDEARAALYASFKGQNPNRLIGTVDRTVAPFVEHDPLPVVAVRVNGQDPIWCSVDTGESDLLLDADYAKRLELETLGEMKFRTTGGAPGTRSLARVDSVGLGEFELHNVPIVIDEIGGHSDLFADRTIDGVIGTALLYQFRPTIDYAGRRLILERRGTPRVGRAHEVVEKFFLVADHVLVSPGGVDDSGPFFWVIETGVGGVAFSPSQRTTRVLGLDGQAPRQLDAVSLGGMVQRNVNVTPGAFPEILADRYGFQIDGLVAHEFFLGHALTFDFDAMELVLVEGGLDDQDE